MNEHDNRQERLQAVKQAVKRQQSFAGATPEQIRAQMRSAADRLPRIENVQTASITIGGMRGERVRHAANSGSDHRMLLYIHGGGFIAGDCATYRDVAGRIAVASGIDVVTFEYRLAPEHVYPAANDDVWLAYTDLLEQGYDPAEIMLGGDSVGATLALMTLLRIRDEGRPLPAGAVLLSPHTDLIRLDGESYTTNAELDPQVSRAANKALLAAYWGRGDELLSEAFELLQADWSGMPQMFIQAGSCEVLLSDAIRLTDRLRTCGSSVRLDIAPDLWTAYYMLGGLLPEASAAIVRAGSFIRRVFGLEPNV